MRLLVNHMKRDKEEKSAKGLLLQVAMLLSLATSVVSRSSSKLSFSRSTGAFGFQNKRLFNYEKASSVKRYARPSKGQMSMWGEGPDDTSENVVRSIPVTTPPARRDLNNGPRKGEWGETSVDSDGRKIRQRRGRDSSNENEGRNGGSNKNNGGWDDFMPEDDFNGGLKQFEYSESRPQTSRSRENNRGRGGGRGRGGEWREGRGGGRGRGGGGRGRGRGRGNDFSERSRGQSESERKEAADRKINLRALEGAGFVHLYGLAPILNALSSNRRAFTNPESTIDLDDLNGEERDHEVMQRERKPEAKFAPCLLVQENNSVGRYNSGKSAVKAASAKEVEDLANQLEIPISYVDKGVLNTLCGSRPHQVRYRTKVQKQVIIHYFRSCSTIISSTQGYVLRCGSLEFEPMPRISHPKNDPTSPKLWLVLDEVVDPQNFGALLRSAHFLGGISSNGDETTSKIGIMVCAKNSAPASAVVSAASAGALEVCQVYSTSNLPRTLNAANEDGWRILGAAASAPDGMDVICEELHNVETADDAPPTILVLGSEGHGLRTLVSRACTGFVRIPGIASDQAHGEDGTNAGVDSLNVSVTGGIMLWHFLNK